MFTTTISTEELETRLDDSGTVVVDCRSSLTEPEYGRNAYAAGHIPGAIFVSLDDSLSQHGGPEQGRHPLPDAEKFINLLGKIGINNDSQVVVYDDVSGAIAGRLWWMLSRWLGHAKVCVLDGGIKRWVREERGLSTEATTLASTTFEATVDDSAWITTAELEGALKTGSVVVVDARTAERYDGKAEPIDPVAGHIPGAVNLFLGGNLHEGVYKDDDALRARFADVVAQAGGADNVVHSCGSGVSALHNMIAMEKGGLSGSRLYVGSWSEWIRDSTRPIGKNV